MTLSLDDPWLVREQGVDASCLGSTESVFALANGYVGMRGTLDEGDPRHAPGMFMSGVYETHPLAYPEGGYGHPEQGEAMVGVADGSAIRLLVDGVSLDVRSPALQHHERVLDLRAGTLEREVLWRAASGALVRVRSSRLVSLTQCSVCAIRYEVAVLEGSARVLARSGLVVNESPPEIENDDPRVGATLDAPFEALAPGRERAVGGLLVHQTRRSKVRVAAAVEHVVGTDSDVAAAEIEEGLARADAGLTDTDAAVDRDTGVRAGDGPPPVTQEADPPPDASVRTEVEPDRIVTSAVVDLRAGQRLVLVKHLGHAASDESSADTLTELALAALTDSVALGWDELARRQRAFLDDFWRECDVELDGDPELQVAVRYCLFQLLSSAVCIDDAPLGAKGLTGSGYSGHTFWDIEGFVLPALTLLRPEAAARLLGWRSGRLDLARERADVLDLQGASFPWRTISGREVSAYWPASTAAMHVNADIARAFDHWSNATGRPVEEVGGLGVLVETARLWISMGNTDTDGRWHLFGMTGPDEYTGVVDDNVFTNLMAQRNLRVSAQLCEADAQQAARLGVDADEIARWHETADAVYVPWDEARGVHPANEGFTSYREWRFSQKTDRYPVQEHSHYAKIYRRQVLKQADLVQAIWWCRDAFTPEQVAADLEYYEARTVRDSSLSAAVQAVVCAQADHVDLAYAYAREAALVDLRDVNGDGAKGLHLASIAGSWFAIVAGLGGLREDHEVLELAPHLPSALTRTAYRVHWRGRLLHVETTAQGTTVSLPRAGDEPVDVVVDDRTLRVTPSEPVRVPLKQPAPLRDTPTQPAGREPRA